jgi:electron transfer flavoprotein beta subunit
MKVLVAVTEVGQLASGFDVEDGTIPETSLSYDCNEWDDYAVEAAVRLAESLDDVDVVAVTVGPERCERTLRRVLARGVDRAVRVWDDALAAATLPGPRATAAVLAAVVEREAPDLVLTGVQAADDGFGATGVALAERLGYGWAAIVTDVDVDAESTSASVRRELEGGVSELTTVSLPAVLTIQTGIAERRPASDAAVRGVDGEAITVESLASLGVDRSVLDADPTLSGLARAGGDAEPTRFESDPEETAADLETILREAGAGEGTGTEAESGAGAE